MVFTRKNKWDDKKVVLFVSTGRTGTKFFAELFNECALNSYVTHEPKPNIVPTAVNYLSKEISEKAAIKKILDLRSDSLKYLQKHKINNYVESNGGFTFLSPILNSLFKNLVVIHIIRNPFDWVLSAYNRQHENKSKYETAANWAFTGNQIRGYKDIDWEKSTTIEKLAWTWFVKNKILQENFKNSENYFCVKFENIFHSVNGSNEILQIINFIESKLKIEFDSNFNIKDALSVKSNPNQTEFLKDIRWHPEFSETKFLQIINPLFGEFY